MKCYPSENTLNNPMKQNGIQQILNDINTNLNQYMQLLLSSIIKEKQVLTTQAKQVLKLPEHRDLMEKLNEKYPQHQIDSKCCIQYNIINKYK